jgi:methyl-accepting chemotaxis protein
MNLFSVSIRTSAKFVVVLVVASFLCGTGFTYWSVRQQRAELAAVHAAAELVANYAIALVRDAKDIQVDVVQVQQFLSDISATRSQDGLDDGLKHAQEFAVKFGQHVDDAMKVAEALHRPDVVRLLFDTKTNFGPYFETGKRMAAVYIERGPAGGNAIMPDFDKASEALQSKMEQLLSVAEAVVADTTRNLGGTISRIEAYGDQLIWRMAGLGLIGTLLITGLGVVAMIWVVRPISRMTDAMRGLADGDLAVTVSGQERRDEIGAMAAAVLVFRDHMIAERRLAADQAEERQRADVEKRSALKTMANRIETDTTAALHEVDTRTSVMAKAADEMSASAVRTGEAAGSAATAAAQALANAETVASAAEELSASIREIGVQVTQSTEVVGRAVAVGQETQTSIEALNEQVARIGAVADMISEIAAKTNLLALNATIEAARAGDAGKGFAVVASEVKQLATQTARSTEEIAQHIGHVRSATGASVSAVNQIQQIITEVNAIGSSIAAAVEEQQAATAEIARNVSETASAANEMTRRTQDVSSEAEQTGRHASDVRKNALGLDSAVQELRHSVIRVVRTSTDEVDRRLDRRYEVDIGCRLAIDGDSFAAQVTGLSAHGASVRDGPAMSLGARGTLVLDGTAGTIPFRVRSAGDRIAHLEFDLDEASAPQINAILKGLVSKAA